MRDRLSGFHEWVEFLIGVRKRLARISQSQDPNESKNVHDEDEEECDVLESFNYLLSKTNAVKRFAINYLERAEIQINLVYNISNQIDSRTNLEIARLTSKISVSAQRDSSSMIT